MVDRFCRRALRATFACTLLLGAGGCGGSKSFEKSLDDMWQWDGGVEASHVISALQGAQPAPTVPVAIGVTGRGLVGRSLPDGKLWTYEKEVDVLPSLAGRLVLFTTKGKLTALDATTGKKEFSLSVNDRRLEGAGFDGENVILLLVDKDDAREDQILVVDTRGNQIYSATANARLGTPAAIGGIGLVPYAGQYVGGLDLKTGKHIGRVLVRDGLHTVTSAPEGVVMYGAGATLLDTSVTSSPDSRSLKLDPRELPGEPSWPIDGSKPRGARGNPVGLYAHVAPEEGTLKFSTGGYVATYYEVALGLEHGSNEIRWATHFPRAVAGGASGKSGPTLCLENGAIIRVNSKTGHHIPFGTLDAKVKACVVGSPDSAIPPGDRPSVLEQLEETIAATGPDMVAIQKVMLTELAQVDTAETTKSLLAIAQNPLVSLDLAKKAGSLLGTRTKGGEEMIRALKESAPQPLEEAKPDEETKPDGEAKSGKDEGKKPPKSESDSWTESPEEEAKKLAEENEGVPQPGEPAIDPNARRREKLRPPPVAALAKALAQMKTPGAGPALAPYLEDPSLSAKQQRVVMDVIAKLGTGTPEEIEHVTHFVYQYKNTGGEAHLIQALVVAVHFLFKYGTEEETAKLKKDLGQSLTYPALTEQLKKNPPPQKAPEEGNGGEEDKSPPKK